MGLGEGLGAGCFEGFPGDSGPHLLSIQHRLSLWCVSELELDSSLRTHGNNSGNAQKSLGIRPKAFSHLSKWMELLSAS